MLPVACICILGGDSDLLGLLHELPGQRLLVTLLLELGRSVQALGVLLLHALLLLVLLVMVLMLLLLFICCSSYCC